MPIVLFAFAADLIDSYETVASDAEFITERTSDKRIKVTAKNITLYPWEGIMAHKKRDHRVIIVIGEWNLTVIKAVLIVATLSGQGVGI